MQPTHTILRSDTTIGFLGAGQLARMSALQAFRFGFRVASYSDRASGEPLQWMTPTSSTGSFADVDALTAFAKGCDLVTLENEFIDSHVLAQVQEASGVPILPSPSSFALIESKFLEKETFRMAGIPVAPYAIVRDRQELETFGAAHGWPYLLKSSKGGYDGYGNRMVSDMEEAAKAFADLGGVAGHEILAEARIPFVRELAIQVARNRTGMAVYPCCETIQSGHICATVLSPAPIDPGIAKRAAEMAKAAVEAIDGVGIFAFELFLTSDGGLILNESAPRPHNSGHYTIEGCVTSQFENHIRAVCGLPLGDTSMRRPAAVMINLLGTHSRSTLTENALESLRSMDTHLHLYGKEMSKPGRKMGHVTVLGDDLAALHRIARDLADPIEI